MDPENHFNSLNINQPSERMERYLKKRKDMHSAKAEKKLTTVKKPTQIIFNFRNAKQSAENILLCKHDYIVHQTNCVSTSRAGLAKDIFAKFPYADTYSARITAAKRSKPGTISIHGDGKSQRLIVNMYAQFYPSPPRYSNDSAERRIEWFKECLALVEKKIIDGGKSLKKGEESKKVSIAFPYGIGCNLGGGDWRVYAPMIDDFAGRVKEKADIYVLKKKFY
jgi:hypothetical protein